MREARVTDVSGSPMGMARGLRPGPAVSTLALLVAAAAVGAAAGAYAPSLGDRLLLLVPMALVGFTVFALLARRWPAQMLVLIVLLGAFAGTLEAFVGFRIRPMMWVIVVAGMAGLAWRHLLDRRGAGAVPITPTAAAAVALGFVSFVAFHLLAGGLSGNAPQAAVSVAIFAGPFLFATYAPMSLDVRWRIGLAVIGVVLLAGAYAMFRLVVGPASQETAMAVRANSAVGGELALFGSFHHRTDLGGWTAVMAPVMLAFALASRGWVRLSAIAGLGMMLTALIAAETRIAIVAGAAALAVVVGLYVASRAFDARRILVLGAGLATLAALGIVGFTVTVSDKPESVERLERIFTPGNDNAVQARRDRWNMAIPAINERPLTGYGLGTAGATYRTSGTYWSPEWIAIDNAYLSLAYQVGWIGLALFFAFLVALGLKLALGALRTRDPRIAALAMGAAGAMGAWAILMTAGGYHESKWASWATMVIAGTALGAVIADRLRSDRHPGEAAEVPPG